MPMEMRLPQFDMLDADATIVQWLKKEGEHVGEGEPVVDVETAKAAGTLEAPFSGVLSRIVAQPGATITSGAVMAIIEPD